MIARTVRSILDNGYPDLEIVVVDDGSKDSTLAVLRQAFGADTRVRILTQPNRGKAEALNHGIRESSHDLLVAVDADTIFQPGTIAKLLRHFSDPRSERSPAMPASAIARNGLPASSPSNIFVDSIWIGGRWTF